ncbi:MAG: DegV family protein [Coriobacteriia bacterium]|nr:DegV family protein [Coriobacteriia bacterium]
MTVIMTDSTSDFTLDEAKELNVEMISLKVNFGSEYFADKTEISAEDFYEKMKNTEQLPTTCLVSVGEFIDVFNAHPNEEIVLITLSSELSGTNNSAHMAKDQLKRDDILIVDSRTAAIGLNLLVRLAVDMRTQGVLARDIAYHIEQICPRVRVIVVLETLENLIKGGRLSSTKGRVATMLSLKLIIEVDNGIVHDIGKARGFKTAMRKAADIVHADEMDKYYPIAYASALNEEGLAAFVALIGRDGVHMSLGSVVGVHTGSGAVAVAYFRK